MPNEIKYERTGRPLIQYSAPNSVFERIKEFFKKMFFIRSDSTNIVLTKQSIKDENYFSKENFYMILKKHENFFEGFDHEELVMIEEKLKIREILREINELDFKTVYNEIIEESEVAKEVLSTANKEKLLWENDNFEKELYCTNKNYYNELIEYYEIKKMDSIQVASFINKLLILEKEILEKAVDYFKKMILELEKLNAIEEKNGIEIDFYSYNKKYEINKISIKTYSDKLNEYNKLSFILIEMEKYFGTLILEKNGKVIEHFNVYLDAILEFSNQDLFVKYQGQINLFNEIFKSYVNYIYKYCRKDFKKDNSSDYMNCYISIGEGNILNNEQVDIVNYIYNLNKK